MYKNMTSQKRKSVKTSEYIDDGKALWWFLYTDVHTLSEDELTQYKQIIKNDLTVVI